MKLRTLAIYLVVTACSLNAKWAAEAASPTSPRIVFEKQTFDFGEIKRGDVVKHSFFFTNMGPDTLRVLDVRPGCGCTTAASWDKEVPPGKAGSIPLQFNSTGFSGPVSKPATIVFDDPAQSNVVLQLSGKIWTPIDVTPTAMFFQYSGESTNTDTRTVKIKNNEKDPLVLEAPQVNTSAFKVELKTVKPGQEFELLVSTTGNMPTGTLTAPIVLKTSSKEMPTVTISAIGVQTPAVTYAPTQLILPTNHLAAELRVAVAVQSASATPFSLTNAQINAPGARVEVTPIQQGRSYYLSAIFPAGFTVERGTPIEMTVNTSHPKYPVIKVPVIARVLPTRTVVPVTTAPSGVMAVPVRNSSP